ncbi:MAG TPA: hypothetical protein VG345_03180, partial [Bryobacteraceae bacterium]|nr:hypothetical protein [Bryobacteraceae bacterium]
ANAREKNGKRHVVRNLTGVFQFCRREEVDERSAGGLGQSQVNLEIVAAKKVLKPESAAGRAFKCPGNFGRHGSTAIEGLNIEFERFVDAKYATAEMVRSQDKWKRWIGEAARAGNQPGTEDLLVEREAEHAAKRVRSMLELQRLERPKLEPPGAGPENRRVAQA